MNVVRAPLAYVAAAALPATGQARRASEGETRARAPGPPGLARRLLPARAAGAMGVAGVLTILVTLSAALALYPHFSFWDDNLSVLGVSGVAPLFNGGVIVCGVLEIFLALGAGVHLAGGRPFPLAGAALLAGGMAMLAAIGVFTEAFGLLHFYIAVAFFALFITASLALGIALARGPAYRRIGYLALLSAALGMVAWLLPTGNGIALPELVASVPGLAWLGLLGIKMANDVPARAA